MISPLVQGASTRTKALRLLLVFTLGALLSSSGLGLGLGAIGGVVVSAIPRLPAALAVSALGLSLAACDVGFGPLRTPSAKRQTQPAWWRSLGPARAMFLWGIDLGLGLSTVRVASLYWMMLLVTLLIGSPWVGAAVLASYACASVVGIAWASLAFERRRGGVHANIDALRLLPAVRLGLISALVAWSAALPLLSRVA